MAQLHIYPYRISKITCTNLHKIPINIQIHLIHYYHRLHFDLRNHIRYHKYEGLTYFLSRVYYFNLLLLYFTSFFYFWSSSRPEFWPKDVAQAMVGPAVGPIVRPTAFPPAIQPASRLVLPRLRPLSFLLAAWPTPGLSFLLFGALGHLLTLLAVPHMVRVACPFLLAAWCALGWPLAR